MSSTIGVSDWSHSVGNRYRRPNTRAAATRPPINNMASIVRLNILPRRCCRVARSWAERKALMSGVDGADSIGGVYIGLACGMAAGNVGNAGPAPAGGSVGIAGAAPATAAGGSGTIGTEGALTDGGSVVPGFDPESSNTERRAVTYGPDVGSWAVTGPGATGASGAGRSPRRGSGSSGGATACAGSTTGAR